MFYLLNAFSINMIETFPCFPVFREVGEEKARELARTPTITSAVGHADTAAVFSAVLGTEVPMNRVTVVLKNDDIALVGQYSGSRLPEGATSLPPGATIRWFFVSIGC